MYNTLILFLLLRSCRTFFPFCKKKKSFAVQRKLAFVYIPNVYYVCNIYAPFSDNTKVLLGFSEDLKVWQEKARFILDGKATGVTSCAAKQYKSVVPRLQNDIHLIMTDVRVRRDPFCIHNNNES